MVNMFFIQNYNSIIIFWGVNRRFFRRNICKYLEQYIYGSGLEVIKLEFILRLKIKRNELGKHLNKLI